jgi:hypothetical protein
MAAKKTSAKRHGKGASNKVAKTMLERKEVTLKSGRFGKKGACEVPIKPTDRKLTGASAKENSHGAR